MGEVIDWRLQQALTKFQDWRFGLFMHWGIYSVWGAVESWPIEPVEGYGRASLPQWRECGEDLPKFQRLYWDLNRQFNPKAFDPKPWVEAAKHAGMKYVIFTTKHHDGFSMFDTKQTDYRVTHPDCPFHDDPRADIAKVVFDAFREAGFGIGAYFSKPDWHHPDFWDPDRPIIDKHPNYDPQEEPETWRRFVRFTHAQVEELMTRYAPIDILWFDGAWVAPPKYDIDIDSIARMARSHNPDVIVVDRWVPGPHENYQTPEQKVPPEPLDEPWESCITMGDQWSWRPNENYKSVRRLVHMLVDVAAKGGNLLLNIGPDAQGRWDQAAYDRLSGVGDWMANNGEAIHGTRPVAPFAEASWRFTRKGQTVYAVHLAPDDETLPAAENALTAFHPREGTAIRVLGYDGAVNWRPRSDGGGVIELPEAARRQLTGQPAWTAAMTP